MAPSGWPGGSGGGGSWPPTGAPGGSGGAWPPTGGSAGGSWPPTGAPGGAWPPASGGSGGGWPATPAAGASGGPSGGQQWPPAAGPTWPGGSGAPAPSTPAPDWAAGFTPAGGDESGTTARPPLLWLYLGFLGPVVGIGVLVLMSGWLWNVVGWFVSIALGLGMLVVFTGADLRRRASPWYLARPGLVGGLRLAVAAAAIVVAGVHAYYFADHIARLDVWVA